MTSTTMAAMFHQTVPLFPAKYRTGSHRGRGPTWRWIKEPRLFGKFPPPLQKPPGIMSQAAPVTDVRPGSGKPTGRSGSEGMRRSEVNFSRTASSTANPQRAESTSPAFHSNKNIHDLAGAVRPRVMSLTSGSEYFKGTRRSSNKPQEPGAIVQTVGAEYQQSVRVPDAAQAAKQSIDGPFVRESTAALAAPARVAFQRTPETGVFNTAMVRSSLNENEDASRRKINVPSAAKTFSPSFNLPASAKYIRTGPGKPQGSSSDIPRSRFGVGSKETGSLSGQHAAAAPNEANPVGEDGYQGDEQSSGLVGELWLDTSTLQNWLHSYLTNEMQSRSGMAAKAESAFAFI